jgi:hypothetical protein
MRSVRFQLGHCVVQAPVDFLCGTGILGLTRRLETRSVDGKNLALFSPNRI